ncbi:MAG: HD domain-containing protein [Deltaproteobacteria bacterium]|nr:HD domain-containing protein [Deltaproteobacteria bacterium]
MPDAGVQKVEEILRNINAAIKVKKLYPPNHPSIVQLVGKACEGLQELLIQQDRVFIGRVDEALVFDEIPILEAEKTLGEITLQMKKTGIEGIAFQKGFSMAEFTAFLDILLKDKPLKGIELQQALLARGITHITLKSIPPSKEEMVEAYHEAVGVVQMIMNERRLGKTPRTRDVSRVVNTLTDMVLEDKNSMIGLTMIKSYDSYLFNHSVNVSILSIALGEGMGYSKPQLYILGMVGILHDIGKIGVSEDLIRKPGSLSGEEWHKVQQHPETGSKIAGNMEDIHQLVPRVILEHHIGYDHSGYPQTRSGLHPFSMIITVTDTYDALTTLRVYQGPRTPVEAIQIMNNLSGKKLDPQTLKAFTSMVGIYPVGTLVRLVSNEIGIVTRVLPEKGGASVIKVLFNSDGVRLTDPYELDLSDGRENHIIAPIDPLTKDINLSEFFEKEAKAPAHQGP